MNTFKDMTGLAFGRLTVVARTEAPPGRTDAWWRCRCECGRETVTRGVRLRGGKTKSCGCLAAESLDPQANRTHGMTGGRAYSAWSVMHNVCRNPRAKDWKRYGGAGVTVDPAWNSFEAFIAEMKEPPSDKHVLARLDTSGGYHKGNCVWMPREETTLLKRNAILITHNGVKRTANAWAKEIGLNGSTLASRLRAGWTPKMAIETPVIRGNRR